MMYTFYKAVRGSGPMKDEMEMRLTPPILQQQKGITDCGLFAIAFAVHLAFEDMSKLTFD